MNNNNNNNKRNPLRTVNVNIEMLPPPSQIIETKNFKLWLWGWIGFNIDFPLIKDWDAGKLLAYTLEHARGIFFIMIIDYLEKRGIFLPDLYSCKKIFYFQAGDKIYLSDFLYKFKPLPDTGNEIDIVSTAFFLMYGYIPANDTLYKRVKSLKPFTYYVYKGNRLEEHEYYKIDFLEKESSYQDALHGIFHLFEKRFLALTEPFNKFLIPLSGGRDSRFLSALALKHFEKKRIQTFTFGQPGTFDFEIGRGFAKKHKIDAVYLPFNQEDYFEEHILPGTKYKNGLINHVMESPAKFYEKILNSPGDRLIVSGYIGDAVLAWAHQRKIIADENNFPYPAPSHFSLNDVVNMFFPQYKEECYSRLKKLTDRLYDENRNLEPEKWLYHVHAPYFTNPCMFSEEKFYAFALPFIDPVFFEYIKAVPAGYKAKNSFYQDVLKTDPYIYGFFHYPLKNRRGFGYGNNKITDLALRGRFYLKSVLAGARPMKNYINFNKIYTGPFLDWQIAPLKQFPGFHYILNKENLTQKQKILLFSLKLNLETFF
jgi:asparagine synthase (glutamine-hydrolysing)